MLTSIKISGNSAFLGLDRYRILFFPLINVKMPTIIGILTFICRKNFMLSGVEHKKKFYNFGAEMQTNTTEYNVYYVNTLLSVLISRSFSSLGKKRYSFFVKKNLCNHAS